MADVSIERVLPVVVLLESVEQEEEQNMCIELE